MKNEEVDECGGLVDEYEISNATIKRLWRIPAASATLNSYFKVTKIDLLYISI